MTPHPTEGPSHPTVAAGDFEFRRLLEKMPAGAYTCDAHGLITYFNQRAVELWGRAPSLNDPADRFCGSFKLFTTDGAPIVHERCWMALALLDDREYNGFEIVVERPDGSRRTALAHANPLHDATGRISGAVNVLVDITDRKQVEDELREADRRKSEFLATLSHELRNPLAPLRHALQVMRLAPHDRSVVEEARGVMERQVSHMVRLIDDLLDLSRITNGRIELRKERLDLAAVVHDAIETSRPAIEEARHELGVSLPERTVFVEGDRTRLAQVFANLLNNSARYTAPGGHIEVVAERQGSDVVVKVRDDGDGIDPALLPTVFDMFTQAGAAAGKPHPGGLGVGLSLARALVERHGGTIEVSSEGHGRGSEFLVRLPADPAGHPAAPEDEPAAATARSNHRILVVDDSVDAAAMLATMLRITGHETRTARDGLEALEAAEAFRPQVLLLDLGLPKLNGYEVCRRLRAEPWGAGMVIIALTGWGQEEDRRQSKEAGFNFHMVKPVDPRGLEKMLDDLLVTPL